MANAIAPSGASHSCADADLGTWLKETIPFYDAQGVIALAQGLDARVSEALLELGQTNPVASLAVGNAALDNVHQPDADGLERLVRQLVRRARDIERGDAELPERVNRPGVKALEAWQKRRDRGPSSWTLVEMLCTLELPESLRTVRDQALGDLQLAQPYPDIARAIVALVEARSRALTSQELRDVQAAVDVDIPERPQPIQKRRRTIVIRDSVTPRGLSIVAELATDHLDELAAGSDRKLYEISRRVGIRDSRRIVRRLNEAGVDTKPWQGPSPLAGFVTNFAEHVEHERTLLEDIVSLGDRHTELTDVDRWSLSELGDLLHATGYDDVDFAEFRSAVTRDTAELRQPWLRRVAVVHGLDLDKLAAQAQFVLAVTSGEDTARRVDEWRVISEESAPPPRTADFALMGDDEQQAAVAGLSAYSDWIVHSAMWLLFHATATWDRETLFNQPLDEWVPTRSSAFRQVAIVADPPSREMLERAAASEHSAYRHAARRSIERLPSLDVDGAILAELATDPDQWVRGGLRTRPPTPQAEYWSCPWCPCRNAMHVEDCRGCVHGSRPELDD